MKEEDSSKSSTTPPENSAVISPPARSTSTPTVTTAQAVSSSAIASSASSPAAFSTIRSPSSISGASSFFPNMRAKNGWFDGLLVCLRPVWGILGKASGADNSDAGICYILFYNYFVSNFSGTIHNLPSFCLYC